MNMRKGTIRCSFKGWYTRMTDLFVAVRHKQLTSSMEVLKGERSYPSTLDRWAKKLKKVPVGSILLCPNIQEIFPEERDNFFREMARDMDHAQLCIATVKIPLGITGPGLSELKQGFTAILTGYDFYIGLTGYCRERMEDTEKNTLMWILFPPRALIEPKGKSFEDFKVVAIIATYNEEDVIASISRKLAIQGIGVYIIDNWSTDSTIDILQELYDQGTLLGFERYPEERPSGIFDLKGILTRKEDLARQLRADWIIHHDADEIRLSPWKEKNLKEAIFLVDKMGFNAIDHTVIDFVPVDNGYASGLDVESYFFYFKFNKSPFPRINAWRNSGYRVNLGQYGGHEVKFKGRRIFPFKFLIKHYPVRTQDHGERKFLEERQPRSNKERDKFGWHTHYYRYKKGYTFIKDPERLLLFDNDQFWEQYIVERLSGILSS